MFPLSGASGPRPLKFRASRFFCVSDDGAFGALRNRPCPSSDQACSFQLEEPGAIAQHWYTGCDCFEFLDGP